MITVAPSLQARGIEVDDEGTKRESLQQKSSYLDNEAREESLTNA